MAKKKGSRSRRDARSRGLGILFWLCLAVVLVAVAASARVPLQKAILRLAGGTSAPQSAPRAAPQVTVTPLVSPAPAAPSALAPVQKPAPAAVPATNPTLQQQGSPAFLAQHAPETVQKPAARRSRLFFTAVDTDGKIVLKSVIRAIPATDSPLRDTLQALLNGPTAQELNLGMVSMIPMESRLRGVTMRGDTAVIDFSESFRFNAQGIDALNAQLRQVVYAATEFPSVKKVQVLIEGKTVRYLGMEGVRIDQPLTRSSFAQ